ncbi:unnamed protein product [Xylocopa violacea]|uniref:Uncharacterized protein n=1 Tax=Xylocopa violacea TaxID=135666 RepID=A0ABP1P6Y4_XYLVO
MLLTADLEVHPMLPVFEADSIYPNSSEHGDRSKNTQLSITEHLFQPHHQDNTSTDPHLRRWIEERVGTRHGSSLRLSPEEHTHNRKLRQESIHLHNRSNGHCNGRQSGFPEPDTIIHNMDGLTQHRTGNQ